MNPAAREFTAAIAALLSGGLGAVALAAFPDSRRQLVAYYSGDPEITLADIGAWTSLQANAITVGAVVAVPVCALLAHRRSRRVAWIVAAACTAIIGLLTVVTPTGTGRDVIACYYLHALAAGALVGGAAAAAWGRRITELSLLLGFAAAISATCTIPSDSPWSLDDAMLWWPWLALLPTIAAAATAHSGFRANPVATSMIWPAIAAAVGYAVLNRLAPEFVELYDVAPADAGKQLAVALAAAVFTVAIVAFATAFAPAEDARFVLVAIAVTVAVSPLYTVGLDDLSVGWPLIPVAAVALVAGIRIAGTTSAQFLGIAVLAATTLLSVAWPEFGSNWTIVLRVALLGFGTGHALAANLPANSAYIAAGFIIVPTSVAIPLALCTPASGADGGSRPAAAIALAFVVGCGAAVFARRQSLNPNLGRPTQDSASNVNTKP